jgi:hypothetical protein
MRNVLLFQSQPLPLGADALTEFAEQHHDSLFGNPLQVPIQKT